MWSGECVPTVSWYGAFTDAYVEPVVEGCRRHDVAMLSALLIHLDLEQASASQWIDWMRKKLSLDPSEAEDLALKSAARSGRRRECDDDVRCDPIYPRMQQIRGKIPRSSDRIGLEIG